MKTVYVIIYSAYGHVERMAQGIIKGLEKSSVKAKLFQVQETLPQDVLTKMNVKTMPHIPTITANDLSAADGFMFGFPTRFGMVPAQFKALLDSCGKLWVKGELAHKFVGTFVSTGSLGFGQEGTHLSMMPFFAHLGMIYVPLGSKCPLLFDLSAAHGGSPYGAGTLASSDGSRTPSELELSIAEFQGQEFVLMIRVAEGAGGSIGLIAQAHDWMFVQIAMAIGDSVALGPTWETDSLSHRVYSNYHRCMYWIHYSPFSIPSLAVVYWIFFFIYSTFLLITLFFSVKYGSNYVFHKRGLKVCVISSALNLAICSIFFCYEANYNFPLIPVIWMYNFFAPLFVVITWIFRGLVLLQRFHYNRRILLSLRNSKVDFEPSNDPSLHDDLQRTNAYDFSEFASSGIREPKHVPCIPYRNVRSFSIQAFSGDGSLDASLTPAYPKNGPLRCSSSYTPTSSFNTPLNRKISMPKQGAECILHGESCGGHGNAYGCMPCHYMMSIGESINRTAVEGNAHCIINGEHSSAFIEGTNAEGFSRQKFEVFSTDRHRFPSSFPQRHTEELLESSNRVAFPTPRHYEAFSSRCQCRACFWRALICNLPVIRVIVFLFCAITNALFSLFTFRCIYMSRRGPWIFTLLLSFIHFAISLSIHVKFTTSTQPDLIPLSDIYVISFVSNMFYAFIIIPVLLYQASHITDAFGIRRDLFSTFLFVCPGFCILLLWTSIDLLQPLRCYVPVSFLLLVGGFFVHSVVIVVPLISVIFGEAHQCQENFTSLRPPTPLASSVRSMSPPIKRGCKNPYENFVNIPPCHKIRLFNSLGHLSSVHKAFANLDLKRSPFPQRQLEGLTLDKIFSDGILLAKFKKFTITEFAVENLLFYEICKEYKQLLLSPNMAMGDLFQNQMSSSSSMNQNYLFGSSSLDKANNLFYEPALQIYSKFIKSGSTYEINIDGRTKKKIEDRINECRIREDLFDEALDEVARLLVSWSLPRFLETLKDDFVQSYPSNTPPPPLY